VTTTGADASAFVGALKRKAPAIITAVVIPKAVIVFVIIKIKIRKRLVEKTNRKYEILFPSSKGRYLLVIAMVMPKRQFQEGREYFPVPQFLLFETLQDPMQLVKQLMQNL